MATKKTSSEKKGGAAKKAPAHKAAPKKAAAKKPAAHKAKKAGSTETAAEETSAEGASEAEEAAKPREKRHQRISTRPWYSTPRGVPSNEWHLIDAEGQVVGRLATRIASILAGKHRPNYSRDVLCGDHVVVVNAAKIRLTGNKATEKLYYRHSMYPGGLKITTAQQMFARHPERVLQLAVKGMLPKNQLGRQALHNLRVFNGPDHNHQAQLTKKAS